MRFSSVQVVFSLAFGVIARPADPQPECDSNLWEKFHELHIHDINTGYWFGIPTGLVFPGGSECYRGKKVVSPYSKKTQEIPEWMKKLPGFDAAASAGGISVASQSPTPQPTQQPTLQYQPQYQPQYSSQSPAPYQAPQYPYQQQPQYQYPSQYQQQSQEPAQPTPSAQGNGQSGYSPYVPVLSGGSATESAQRPSRTYTDPKNPNIIIVEVYAK
jgi:hypothetical protein